MGVKVNPQAQRKDCCTYLPNLHFVGDEKTEDGKMYHVMVMDMLGKSLEDLFQECRRKFDLRSVLHIGVQMI